MTDRLEETEPAPTRVEVPAIDGFRGMGTLMVFAFHIWAILSMPKLGGLGILVGGVQIGIDVLFAVSGFVLFLPMATRATLGPLRSYAIRRTARIVPAYWVAIVGMLLLYPIPGVVTTNLPHPLTTMGGWFAIGVHLVFAQTLLLGPVASAFLDNVYSPGLGVNGVVWTLTTEACFYIALPFVAGWYRRHPFVGLAAGLTLSFAWRWTGYHLFELLDPQSPEAATRVAAIGSQYMGSVFATAGQFACGMTAAWLFAHYRARGDTPRWTSWIGIAGAALFALTLFKTGVDFDKTLYNTITDFNLYASEQLAAVGFGAMALAAALQPRSWLRLWSHPAARWIGDRAYGIYLWHLPVLLVLFASAPESWSRTAVRLFVVLPGVPLALFAGNLSYRFIEAPAMRWARRRSQPQDRLRPRTRPEQNDPR